MEELFFFQYHMRMSRRDCMTLAIHERKWLLMRFVKQKEREADAIEKAKKAKK